MDTKLKDFFSDLITASHILHYHGVVDGYGHISARNPENHSTFFMARSLAPGLVESLDDLVEYYVNDGEPVRSDAPRGFLERQIHSQALKKYPTVMSVVHSHSPETIPFSITNVRMRACTSLAGFVGALTQSRGTTMMLNSPLTQLYQVKTSRSLTQQTTIGPMTISHTIL